MTKNNWIWFDMDGTIADLYSVKNWLEDLENRNTRPYIMAKVLYDTTDLLTVLFMLKELGYNIGVISWCAKNSTKEYDRAVVEAKKNWLIKNNFDLLIDKILVTPYGVKKSDTCRVYGKGILVDDEKQNRDAWDLGSTIDASKDIIAALWDLAKTN